MNDYIVTIGVPVFGVEKYIERCAKSLFDQTYLNLEYIFVNDCTPDKSIEKLKEVMYLYPHRVPSVKILNHSHNMGLAAARNTVVRNCTGKFIVWVDSDDFLDINAIETVVRKQKEKDFDIVSFGMKVIKNNYIEYIQHPNVSTGIELAKELLTRNVPVCLAGRLIRTSLYLDNFIIAREGINNGEDYQVSPRLAYFASKVCAISDLLYNYDNRNESSYTFTFSIDKSNQTLIAVDILKHFFKDKGEDFIEALEIGRLNLLTRLLFDTCKEEGHEQYYAMLRKEIFTVNLKYRKNVRLLKRIVFFMSNKKIAMIYLNIVKTVKLFFSKIHTRKYNS